MKKTYINPELQVIKIATQQMLADSTLGTKSGEPSQWGSRELDFADDDLSLFDE